VVFSHCGQLLAVHLAVTREGDHVDGEDGNRQHVWHQAALQKVSQIGHIKLFCARDEAHKALPPRGARNHRHAVGNLRMRASHRLNLSKLNSETIQLHLRVFSSQNLQKASWTQATEVACAEESLSTSRMSDKLSRCSLLVLVVAHGHAQASDVDDTRHPLLTVLHGIVIKNFHRLISQRDAVGNGRPVSGRPTARDLVDVGPDSSFRRPTHADDSDVRVGTGCDNSSR